MYYRKIQIIYCISILNIIGCDRKEITFHQDVKSIIHQNCASCHNEKGAAPFNLISYTDVAKRSKMIAKVTSEKYMPPWPADTEYSSFLNEKKNKQGGDKYNNTMDRGWKKRRRIDE